MKQWPLKSFHWTKFLRFKSRKVFFFWKKFIQRLFDYFHPKLKWMWVTFLTFIIILHSLFFLCFFLSLRNTHLTDSRWPSEYDQKISTWPKTSHRQTIFVPSFIYVTNFPYEIMNLFHFYFFGHIHWFFGQVQRLMFVGVIFQSRSIVHVRQWEFHSVIF